MYQPDKIAELIPSKTFPEPDADGRILLEAAHLIRERGFAQNVLTDDNGSLCLHGAVISALFPGELLALELGSDTWRDLWYRHLPHPAARRLIQANHSRVQFDSLCEWNNASDRTADEVIAALEDAAFMVDV